MTCSFCDGEKQLIRKGKLINCPHCEGTGIEPVNEDYDPSENELDWANGRK